MFGYNIINNPDFTFDKKSIDKIFYIISKSLSIEQNWVLNIVFLDDESIKNLNNNYRNIEKSTDVLSFHYFNNFKDVKDTETSWEIILSENKIIKQWQEYWLWTEKEFYKLLIHSILHILWYDHEKENDYKTMSELEKKIWLEVFEK